MTGIRALLMLCSVAASEAMATASSCSHKDSGRPRQPGGLLLVQTRGSISKAPHGSEDVVTLLAEIENLTLRQKVAEVISSLETRAEICCGQTSTTTTSSIQSTSITSSIRSTSSSADTSTTTTTSLEATTSSIRSTSSSADTSTTTTTSLEAGLCAAFGDPHFITFDGAQTTFVGNMIQWLVKSNRIWIQAIAKDSEGKLLGFAVGGPFMKGHNLTVYSSRAGGPLRVSFDRKPILQGKNSRYSDQSGLLEAYRREDWDSTLFDDDILNLRTNMKFAIGEFPDRFLTLPKHGVFLFKFADSVQVTLTGVDYMSVVISMAAQAGGQGGYCGNFNGEPDDDAEPVVPSWDRPIGENLDAVPEGQSLFPKDISLSLLGEREGRQKDTSYQASFLQRQKKITECPPELLSTAEAACSNQSQAFHKFCIFDVCLTGDAAAAGDVRAAEIMEMKMNARGIPLFMGRGKCLSSEGLSFQSFDTKIRTDEGCKLLLHALALTPGVLGSQLHRGSNCQVLVEPGTDPRSTAIPGGWGASPVRSDAEADALRQDALRIPSMVAPLSDLGGPEQEGPHGEGSIQDTSADAAWSCWALD
eukprot:TRINITY_DN2322_c0_g1_i1.p1 TRINITY_DN2322_c0_g1~~TRINITY_DN2322_c0_g1_i1.p1  ORF type:complete len:588 (+),score=125.02 TRINITY_DN2322_c0_g1_i1:81-1844(+)